MCVLSVLAPRGPKILTEEVVTAAAAAAAAAGVAGAKDIYFKSIDAIGAKIREIYPQLLSAHRLQERIREDKMCIKKDSSTTRHQGVLCVSPWHHCNNNTRANVMKRQIS